MLSLAKALQPHVWLNVHSGMEAMFTPWDHKAEVRWGSVGMYGAWKCGAPNSSHVGRRRCHHHPPPSHPRPRCVRAGAGRCAVRTGCTAPKQPPPPCVVHQSSPLTPSTPVRRCRPLRSMPWVYCSRSTQITSLDTRSALSDLAASPSGGCQGEGGGGVRGGKSVVRRVGRVRCPQDGQDC